jgi:hypothetical protein
LSGRLRTIDEPSAANKESKLQSTPKSKPPAQVSRMSDTLTTRQQQSMSRSKTNNLITHTKQAGSQCRLATQNHSTICTVITCQTCCSAPLHLCQSLPDKRRGRFNQKQHSNATGLTYPASKLTCNCLGCRIAPQEGSCGSGDGELRRPS